MSKVEVDGYINLLSSVVGEEGMRRLSAKAGSLPTIVADSFNEHIQKRFEEVL